MSREAYSAGSPGRHVPAPSQPVTGPTTPNGRLRAVALPDCDRPLTGSTDPNVTRGGTPMLTSDSLVVQERYYRAARAVAAVLVRVCQGSCPEPLLGRVRARLEALPLPTGAFSLAV